jgi:hypothetical protein
VTTRRLTDAELAQSDAEYRAGWVHVLTFGLLGEKWPEPEPDRWLDAGGADREAGG